MQPERPTTPVRGRTMTRYPSNLSKGEPGRVPLHRRGTSKTYETMEDLLRDHGYKETRVFTPEAERIQALADEQKKQRSSWRITDLLSGWITGGDVHESPGEDLDDGNASEMLQGPSSHPPAPRRPSPSSPLGRKRTQCNAQQHPTPSSPSHSASSATLSSMLSGSSDGRTVSYQHIQRRIHHHLPDLRQQPSSTSLRTYAQVSAARGYLRHMASAPNMPKRDAPRRETSIDRLSALLNPPEPPMPPSWLETVTSAVRKSAELGTHVGRPLSRPVSRQSAHPTRATKENKFALATSTGKPAYAQGRSVSGLPPGSALYMQRAPTAPGAVSTAHVVCRSAPGSRSASRVGDRNGGSSGSLRGLPHRGRHERGRRGSKGTHTDRVPSLAATRVEDDGWGMHWVNGKRVPLMLGLNDLSNDADDLDYDEDEDDGELDLARLLVPARRQYSIQSLRRHLHNSHAPHPVSADQDHAWEEEEGVPTRGGRHRRSETEDADGYPYGWAAAPSLGRTETKRRRGLPGAWAGLASSSRS